MSGQAGDGDDIAAALGAALAALKDEPASPDLLELVQRLRADVLAKVGARLDVAEGEDAPPA